MTVVLELLGVAVLILLNGFFVAAEYSLSPPCAAPGSRS